MGVPADPPRVGPAPVVLVSGKDPVGPVGGRIGGHAVYVRAHARAARQAGFEPHLFAVAGQDQVVADPDLGTIHRVRVAVRPGRPWMIPAHAGPLARAIQRFVLDTGSGRALLHGFGVWGDAAVLAARRLRRRGVAAVAVQSAYGTYADEAEAMVAGLDGTARPLDRARFRLLHAWAAHVMDRHERRAATRARMVLVNYDSVARILRRAYGPGLALRRVPYTSESAFRSPSGGRGAGPPAGVAALAPAAAPLVVTVARHDPRKGLATLLRALARLKGDGIPFRACLVGGGDRLAAHRRLAGRLGLDGQVAITGFVADPSVYLAAGSVFALPSLRESSGSLALIEALQASLPVVASDCDGLPEDVEDGRSGLLVAPGDPAALAAALARLLGDGPLRRRLGRQARARFEERFTADRFSLALEAVYGDLGFEPGRPGSGGTGPEVKVGRRSDPVHPDVVAGP